MLPRQSTEKSMKKVFDRTYPGYGPWQVLESPHALRADSSSRQRIILLQSMALPTIPGCIDNVVHEKVEQRQTCNVYTSSFTSGFHWANGKGGDAVLISQESLNKNKRKGILMTAMGRLKKFEDTAGSSSSNKCFRDERSLCYTVIPTTSDDINACQVSTALGRMQSNGVFW